jgi:hypothetical protein
MKAGGEGEKNGTKKKKQKKEESAKKSKKGKEKEKLGLVLANGSSGGSDDGNTTLKLPTLLLECRVVVAERLLACAMATSSGSGGGGGRRAGGGFLRAAVSSLDARETTVLLFVLRRLLRKVVQGGSVGTLGLLVATGDEDFPEEEDKSSDGAVPLPYLESVCEWCAALLDAHFPTLVFSPSPFSPLASCLKSLAALLHTELERLEWCGDAGQRLASVMAESKRRTESVLRQAALLNGGEGGGDGRGGGSHNQNGVGASWAGRGGEQPGGAMVEYSVEALCI